MPYALFDCDRQVGPTMATELEVWKQALEAGLIDDIPVAHESGGQVLPIGYHVKERPWLLRHSSTCRPVCRAGHPNSWRHELS
jgi:hypothetical protein